MHELHQLANQLDRLVRAISGAKRRGDDERYAWLHVLGRGMSGDTTCLHRASEFVRRWRRCRRDGVRNSDSDDGAPTKLISLLSTDYADLICVICGRFY